MTQADVADTLAQRLVFESAIEGLFVRGLDGRLSPELRQRVRALGVDLDARLLPAYPVTVWVQVVREAALSVFPEDDEREAHRKLGRLLVDGYENTLIGKAMFGVLRVIGPHRALARTAKNFRTGNNYSEVELTPVGPREYTMRMNEVGTVPEFTCGIVAAGMDRAGAKQTRVEVAGRDAAGCLLRVSWDE